MKNYYDLSEEERIALTNRAIAEKRTMFERWNALGSSEAEPWNGRAAKAAEFLSGDRSVVDLGCGTMTLAQYIEEGTAYFPVDVTARKKPTIICDFNTSPVPIISGSTVSCLGLIEYILQPEKFLSNLSHNYKNCVISYCVTDAPTPLEPRRAHAWVNDFSKHEIESIFEASGWSIVKVNYIDGVQALWRLSSRNFLSQI